MGWIEKWNKFAKKRIYINETLEIGVGRLIFTSLIFAAQIIWMLILGATPVQMTPAFLSFIGALKQNTNKKKKKESSETI